MEESCNSWKHVSIEPAKEAGTRWKMANGRLTKIWIHQFTKWTMEDKDGDTLFGFK